MARRTYRRITPPHWLDAHRSGSCTTCLQQIRRGDRILWQPARRRAYCLKCGEAQERGIRAEVSVERFGTDCALDC